jgi:hypothetical protein
MSRSGRWRPPGGVLGLGAAVVCVFGGWGRSERKLLSPTLIHEFETAETGVSDPKAGVSGPETGDSGSRPASPVLRPESPAPQDQNTKFCVFGHV